MKNIFYKLLFFVSLLNCHLYTKEYKNFDQKEKKHKSQKAKEKIFQSVGCKYSNTMIVDPEVDMILAQDSLYFHDNQDLIVSLSARYQQDIIKQKLAPMYLKFVSPVIGYGIFAAAPIQEGDFIGVYAGKLRNLHWNEPNFKEDVDYAWYYTIQNKKNEYMVVDGKYEGNELRFINHANDPNTKRIDIIVEDRFYVCYIACKDIKQDEELTVSYGNGYWDSRGIKPEVLF